MTKPSNKDNKDRKPVNFKSNSPYRTLNHLRLGPGHSTNKFCKKIIQLSGSVSPALVWYERDVKLCVTLPHGNIKNPNQVKNML